MFTHGPRMTFLPLAFVSRPIAPPIRSTRPGSKLAAVEMLEGHAVEAPERTPTGPSLMCRPPTFSRPTGRLSKPVPERRLIFSSRLSCSSSPSTRASIAADFDCAGARAGIRAASVAASTRRGRIGRKRVIFLSLPVGHCVTPPAPPLRIQ